MYHDDLGEYHQSGLTRLARTSAAFKLLLLSQGERQRQAFSLSLTLTPVTALTHIPSCLLSYASADELLSTTLTGGE